MIYLAIDEKKLREYMQQVGIPSKRQLAHAASIAPNALNRLDVPKRRNSTIDKIVTLLVERGITDLTPNDLLKFVEVEDEEA